jgi:hypothetical protein
MDFTTKHNDLIYGALDIFLDNDSPELVARDGDSISFVTKLGSHGRILVNERQGWDVVVGEDLIYTIENEVYLLIHTRENAPALERYVEKVSEIYQHNLQDKSKILLESIIKGIVKLLQENKINLDIDLQVGPVLIKKGQIFNNYNISLN